MSPLRLPLLAALVATALCGAAVGCNRSGAMLRDAASADLNCPKNRVHIVGASKTKDVEACGQRATYRFEDGDWVMISREGAAPAAGPQPNVKAGPPGVTPAQPVQTATGTPSMPPSSPPPPSQPPAAGQKAL